MKSQLLSKTLILFTAMALLLSSCKDEDVDPPRIDAQSSSSQVIIVNEGGFQKGNASLSIYDKVGQDIVHKAFENKNMQPIGDVLQSVSEINGDLWLVVNNSGKIWVVDSSSFKIKHEITGFSSPRYALKVSDEKVFVSDLFGGVISVVDLTTFKIETTIPLTGWTEKMVLAGAKAWITNRNTDQLYIVDPYKFEVEDSVSLRMHGGTIFQDVNTADLFVLCEARWDLSTQACIYRLDPQARQVVDSVEFPLGKAVNFLTQSADGASLYYASEGLHKIATNPLSMSQTPIHSLEGLSTYGLGIDPENSDVYIADAGDFTNRGKVLVLDAAGKESHSFETGVSCNSFYFK